MSLNRMKEVDVAGCAAAYMEAQGWDVYQEVSPRGGKRADIVGVQGGKVLVVEAKAAMTFALLEQAMHWRSFADQVVVVTPLRQRRGEFALRHCLAHLRLGWWFVCQGAVTVEAEPPELEGDTKLLKEALHPEQKEYAMAGSSGKYWTPYKAFAKAVREAVEKCPGQQVRDIVWRVKHHYANHRSAQANLRRGAELGWIEGVELRMVDGKSCLFPKAKVKAS